MPTLLLVTDLGKNNTGKISAAELSAEQRLKFQEDTLKPEFYVKPTNRWTCVDTRVKAGTLVPELGEADKQIAGNFAITQAAAATMAPGQSKKTSELLVENTDEAIKNKMELEVHGDTNKGKAGCGALVAFCEGSTLLSNVENADIVAPKVWAVSKDVLELDQYIDEQDVYDSIEAGGAYAADKSHFDVSVDQASDLLVEHGASFAELAKAHNEKQNLLIASDHAFARKAFMLEHPREDGDHDGVFVATIHAYKDDVFKMVNKRGGTERDAALEVMRGLLFNVGTLKGLQAEETGSGEALPVVIVK